MGAIKSSIGLLFLLVFLIIFQGNLRAETYFCGEQHEELFEDYDYYWRYEGKFHFNAELLYMRGYEKGLRCTYALDNPTCGRVKPDFAWQPGFRFTLDYDQFPEWDVSFAWTHFHAHAQFWNSVPDFRWKLDYTTLDAIYAHKVYCKGSILAKVFGTFRSFWADQRVLATFPSRVEGQEVLPAINTRDKQRYMGMGPVLGAKAEYLLGNHFYLFGSLSGGALFGNFDFHIDESEDRPPLAVSANVKNRYGTQGLVEGAFGVRWEKVWAEVMIVALKLSVEHHHYFSHNRIAQCGDFYLNGLNIGAMVEY